MPKANLFICLTPLHALIAQKLLRSNSQNADLLMLCYAETDNAKYRHYFAQTATLCRHADYVLIPPKRWQRILNLRRLCQNLADNYATVYTASIDNINVQYVISHINFDAFQTFDDGTANLVPTGFLYHNPPSSCTRNMVNMLYGIRHQTEDLRRLSQQHHTLYPKQNNIIENTTPIQLWQPETLITNSGSLKPCKILLGQPVFADAKNNTLLAKQIIQQFDIKIYFPHPRETILPENVNIVHTSLIFEDWLMQEQQKHPTTPFELYHLASSAALNVLNFPNLHIQAIRPNLDIFKQPVFERLYDLMQQMDMDIMALNVNMEEHQISNKCKT